MVALAFMVMATAMAWLKPDAAIVVAFLSAGMVLLVLASIPRLPSKVTIGGGSIEYPPEELVTREYAAALESAIGDALLAQWRQLREPEDEATGSLGPPGLDELTQMARDATTRAELDQALDLARASGRIWAQQISDVVEASKSKAE